MASVIGWYGPLIDLSDAVSHIGDFVQLLVLVHRCNPVQYKLAKGGEVLRTDIQVGDNTMPFFTVSLWQKQMAAMAVAGDVILLQNVKITKFGRFVEATTVQFSSLLPLIHPYELLASKGVDDLLRECRAGKTTKDKLVLVIKWVQRTGSALCGIRSNSFQKKQLPRNWKVPEQSEFRDLFLLSEVLLLRKPCKASFSASAGEIFLPITWRALGESEKESMFVSRRIMSVQGSNVVEDFTCIGCQSCGSPLDLDNGSIFKQISASYFCPKTSDHLHIAGLIYRPFMLYVWDESEYVPLLVRNKAAEILFGNLKAERVYSSYKEQKHAQNCKQKDIGKQHHRKNINFHMIWLVLVKMMLQQGKNSPLRFEVAVNPSLDIENGKFEMVSMSIPCIRTKCSSC
ncbi:uncharacterized protein [Euphorbia lathyris]|uniref:uncharacterized protein n=1 Tax=Euphorbia lathyris TaxID=212925 RepID=UPI0033131F38